MADKQVLYSNLETIEARNVRAKWVLGNADEGEWSPLPIMPDKSVHIFGTYGGATIVIQGSNEDGTPTAPVTLTDPQGNALSFTVTDRLEQILENPARIRPVTSGGTGTSLTVIICAKGDHR
jgi:hypothetical protein